MSELPPLSSPSCEAEALNATVAGGRAEEFVPAVPKTLREAGLSTSQVCDMALRLLYLQGCLSADEIAGQIRLAVSMIEDPMRHLCRDKCATVVGGNVLGGVTGAFRFQLTDLGRTRAREAFDQCRYVGPAPVKLSEYVESCRRQNVGIDCCSEETLRAACDDLVISDEMLQELGPAVCSGRSIYLHGPAGNGKTKIAKAIGRMLHESGGDIFVPYAIQAEGAIVTIFDPTVHRPTDAAVRYTVDVAKREAGDSAETASSETTTTDTCSADVWDRRWRRVRRPVVAVGGELTLEMLDLRHNSRSNFYHAPMHIKANGGLFLMDDFGRQLARPEELLNRWVLPLEDQVDFLTLANGKTFSVPFEPLTVFSSNLPPSALGDDAFQRRIRHKIEVERPSRAAFAAIFLKECASRQLDVDIADIHAIFDRHYGSVFGRSEGCTRSPRASDARDLIDLCESIAGYRQQPVVLTADLLDEAGMRFFSDVAKSAA